MADLSHVDLLELIGADVTLRRKSAASGERVVLGGRPFIKTKIRITESGFSPEIIS